MNRQCANGRVRDRTNQPSHEWMRARMTGYINKPPNRPLYQYHQPNTNRQWAEQRKKRSRRGPRLLSVKLGHGEIGTPQQRVAKMVKRETAAWVEKVTRLGGTDQSVSQLRNQSMTDTRNQLIDGSTNHQRPNNESPTHEWPR